MCLYIHIYVYREIQIYSFKLFNYLLVCLEALDISRSKQVLKGQDHKQGVNSETQRRWLLVQWPLHFSWDICQVSMLYKRLKNKVPLAEGQYEDTEKQAKIWEVLWNSMWSYKNEGPDQKSRTKICHLLCFPLKT